jgi:hypothetical protein
VRGGGEEFGVGYYWGLGGWLGGVCLLGKRW